MELLLLTHISRQIHEVARSYSAAKCTGNDLREGHRTSLDRTFRRSDRTGMRSRMTVHFRIMVSLVSTAQYSSSSDNCIPSSVECACGIFPLDLKWNLMSRPNQWNQLDRLKAGSTRYPNRTQRRFVVFISGYGLRSPFDCSR